jgi:hypothetical protein
MIIFSERYLVGDGEKNKEFLFLINKKNMELPLNILVVRNPNWF